VQDYLYSKTGYTAEKFNSLWEIDLLRVIDINFNVATVAKISVKKSEELIYGKENTKGGKLIYSLTKRANGRTVEVDLYDYLKKTRASDDD